MTTNDLARVARIALNGRNNRLDGKTALAATQEERAENILRRLLNEDPRLTRQCALAVVNACVYWGAPLEDYEAVLNGTEDDTEFVVDALFSEWEGSMGGSEDTATSMQLPTWQAVVAELNLATR